jgi:hypothetical protein
MPAIYVLFNLVCNANLVSGGGWLISGYRVFWVKGLLAKGFSGFWAKFTLSKKGRITP